MPSNALSNRRNFIARPIVCKKKPPPYVPPPVPPIPWPPVAFDLHSHAVQGAGWPGPFDTDCDVPLGNGVPFDYSGECYNDPIYHLVMALDMDDVAHTFHLSMMVYHEDWMWILTASVTNHPMIWGVPTIYVIEAWDAIFPAIDLYHVDFTF